ncbi:ribonuclease [Plasmodium yoelii yoelii]|uniref:Cleavage and polyadenylation specificity factor subunit 2 n=2 Tax=Plasmodium yoelii yoelii TaxID=73239 RepID=A0AAE9WLN6_PLAYO|nr:ribonuclease [Plasmodium yoelii yoelii]
MILEIIPLYSYNFYSTLLIIKNIFYSDEKHEGDNGGNISIGDEGRNIIETDKIKNNNFLNDEYNNSEKENKYTKSYNYNYINNKNNFYADKKNENIYILINCGWDDNFCLDDIKNIIKVCEYVDIVFITNHGLNYVGCLPIIYQEFSKLNKKVPIICHEYTKSYSRYILLSYIKCIYNCEILKIFSEKEYINLINDIYQNISELEYKEYYTYKKNILYEKESKKKNSIFILPIYFINNGNNIGSSGIVIKLFNYKILYSINSNIVDYSFIEKSDIINQSNIFTFIGNFMYTNKNYNKMIEIRNIINIVNLTMNNLGCVFFPIDIDNIFFDLLFHINALIELNSQRYVILFLCPYAENLVRLLCTSMSYMNKHIKNNFHKNRVNLFKIKNLICLKDYNDFKKYEDGYYILFSFPSNINNDTSKRILSSFLTNKKNVLILTKKNKKNKKNKNNSICSDICDHYYRNKKSEKNEKSEKSEKNEKNNFNFSYTKNVKVDDDALYEIYLKEKNNIENYILKNINETKKKKKKKEIQDNNGQEKKHKKQNKNLIFESNEEMIFIKKKTKKQKNKKKQTHTITQTGNNYLDNIQKDKSSNMFLKKENLKEESFFEFFKKKKKKDKQKNVNTDPSESSASTEPEEEEEEEEEEENEEDENEEDEDDDEDGDDDEDDDEDGDDDEDDDDDDDEEEDEEDAGNDDDEKFGENFDSYKQAKSEIRIKRELNSDEDKYLNKGHKFLSNKIKVEKIKAEKIKAEKIKAEKIKVEKSDSDISNSSQKDDEQNWENKFIKYNNEKKKPKKLYTNLVGHNQYSGMSGMSDMSNTSIISKKNSWKNKLLKYFKTIPTISKEETVSIQINCKIKIFDIEYIINQNTIKTILFYLNPKHFVLLPSCDSYSSFNFEMLFYSSIKNLTKIHTFYYPSYTDTIKENIKNLLYERYFFRNALSIDSVKIPLNLPYENVYIKNIYTLINSMIPETNNINVFKAKVSITPSNQRDPNLPPNQRSKRFINEHSTFWNEYKGSEYTLSVIEENEDIEKVGIFSKSIQNKRDDNKIEEEKNKENSDENDEKIKKDQNTKFFNYYINDDEIENKSDGSSDDTSSLSSQNEEDLYIQNKINDEKKLKGDIYIGDVSIKNLLTNINKFPNIGLNFVNENQIILNGKASIKKENIITLNQNEETHLSTNSNNTVWRIESSLDPSFYFIRNALKDLHNNMSI